MSDQDLIDAGILRAQAAGVPIDDRTARIIASQWHGGQFTALYALASSGALDLYPDDREDNCPVEDEIEHELSLLATKLVQGLPDSGLNEARQFAIELQALMDYVKARRLAGKVEKQDGWSDLHW